MGVWRIVVSFSGQSGLKDTCPRIRENNLAWSKDTCFAPYLPCDLTIQLLNFLMFVPLVYKMRNTIDKVIAKMSEKLVCNNSLLKCEAF